MMMLSMTIVTMDHFSLPVVAMDVRVVCIRAFQTLGSGLIVLSFKYFVMWQWIKNYILFVEQTPCLHPLDSHLDPAQENLKGGSGCEYFDYFENDKDDIKRCQQQVAKRFSPAVSKGSRSPTVSQTQCSWDPF